MVYEIADATTISYSTVVMYSRDHAELGFSSQKYHPKTTSFMTTWQHWLGPKMSSEQPQTLPKVSMEFNFFYLTELYSD